MKPSTNERAAMMADFAVTYRIPLTEDAIRSLLDFLVVRIEATATHYTGRVAQGFEMGRASAADTVRHIADGLTFTDSRGSK